MNARSMRKRKENVCNSIISNFCGDFFKKKKKKKHSDFFFSWIFVILYVFYFIHLFYFVFAIFFFVFLLIAFTMRTHIIHPSASYRLATLMNKMFSIGNSFFYEALACINALLRLFEHNKCISICVLDAKRRK